MYYMANLNKAINQLHETEPKWFAVYVAFKKEKFVKQLLVNKGIETYLPIQKVIRKYKSKVKKLETPLISCYIFVRIVKCDYIKILETEYVIKFVKIGRDLVAIPDSEINVMQLILEAGVEVTIEQNSFYEGDKVLVKEGSLMGLRGKLIKFYGKERVVVELSTISYTLHIEINKSLLTKV